MSSIAPHSLRREDRDWEVMMGFPEKYILLVSEYLFGNGAYGHWTDNDVNVAVALGCKNPSEYLFKMQAILSESLFPFYSEKIFSLESRTWIRILEFPEKFTKLVLGYLGYKEENADLFYQNVRLKVSESIYPRHLDFAYSFNPKMIGLDIDGVFVNPDISADVGLEGDLLRGCEQELSRRPTFEEFCKIKTNIFDEDACRYFDLILYNILRGSRAAIFISSCWRINSRDSIFEPDESFEPDGALKNLQLRNIFSGITPPFNILFSRLILDQTPILDHPRRGFEIMTLLRRRGVISEDGNNLACIIDDNPFEIEDHGELVGKLVLVSKGTLTKDDCRDVLRKFFP